MSKGVARKTRTTDTAETPSRRMPRGNAPAAAEPRAAAPRALVSHEEIARRAYLLYLERGGQHGYDLTDWLRAEAELAGAARPGNGAGDLRG